MYISTRLEVGQTVSLYDRGNLVNISLMDKNHKWARFLVEGSKLNSPDFVETLDINYGSSYPIHPLKHAHFFVGNGLGESNHISISIRTSKRMYFYKERLERMVSENGFGKENKK